MPLRHSASSWVPPMISEGTGRDGGLPSLPVVVSHTKNDSSWLVIGLSKFCIDVHNNGLTWMLRVALWFTVLLLCDYYCVIMICAIQLAAAMCLFDLRPLVGCCEWLCPPYSQGPSCQAPQRNDSSPTAGALYSRLSHWILFLILLSVCLSTRHNP